MSKLIVAHSFIDSTDQERRYEAGEEYSPAKADPARAEYLKKTGYLQEEPGKETSHGVARKSKGGQQSKDQ